MFTEKCQNTIDSRTFYVYHVVNPDNLSIRLNLILRKSYLHFNSYNLEVTERSSLT